MRCRGFTILEMLWVLLLFSLVATAAGHLFTQSIRGISDQRLRQWHEATRQSLLDHLRADVWASKAAATAGSELRLETSVGPVLYVIEEQRIRRTAPDDVEMQWERLEQPTFAVSGGLVTLQTPSRTTTLVAPLIQAGGGQ